MQLNTRLGTSNQVSYSWISIAIFGCISGLLYIAGAGSLLRYFFVAGAFSLGIFLYSKDLIIYTGFTWWIWFLSPLVRRLADYQAGWQEPNIILLTPFIVTLITFLSFAYHLPKNIFRGGFPFVIASFSIMYGLGIGFVQYPAAALVVPLLNWFTPIMFGFHYFINWRRYPEFRKNIFKVFIWSLLIMGAYGIWQYLVAPEWDRYWLINTELVTFGTPEPRGIRVWSTLNSPQPFGVVMIAGLLLLLTAKQSWLKISAAGVGYISLLLSLARSTYLGWFVGLIVLLASTRSSNQMRIIATIVVLILIIIPVVNIDIFNDVISSRFESLFNPSEDVSYNERADRYARMLDEALRSSLGRGLGGVSGVIDSGILEILLTLGWVGTVPYIFGMGTPILELFFGKINRLDTFPSVCLAISMGVFVQMSLGPVMLGVAGVILWSFLGLGLASNKYHQLQNLHKQEG